MNLAGCQINPIDVNFHLQKSLEILDKNSADKIWSKKDKEIKVSPLMPIRVKAPISTFWAVKSNKQVSNQSSYIMPSIL